MLEPISVQLAWLHQFQSAGFYVAKEKGCDVDKPRNLAKSVTVE
jgi:glucosamine--fructose-6-phosphate aminotransferase (isomerizing)